MGPKPVRIGLQKKPAAAPINEDFSDEGDEFISHAVSVADPVETLDLLSKSTMKVLETIVDLDDEVVSEEDMFAN